MAARQYNSSHNYNAKADWGAVDRVAGQEKKSKSEILGIINETQPGNTEGLTQAIEKFQLNVDAAEFREMFFDGLREKLAFSDRPKYVDDIASHDTLNFFWKLEELRRCKTDWSVSWSSIDDVFKGIGERLVLKHSSDLINYSRLSLKDVREISEFSGVGEDALINKLIENFATLDVTVPASIWMDLATKVCKSAAPSESRAALVRLLEGNASKLSSNVTDGIWKKGLYPAENENQIASAVIWFKLGSATAADRWRGAHTVMSLARLGRWDIVSLLFSKFSTTGIAPFQAPELIFYDLHARLFFLIAMARVAMDFPCQVSVYADTLKLVAFDASFPHVLIRHFAAEAIATCARLNFIRLSSAEKMALSRVNRSSFPLTAHKYGTYVADGWHSGRPKDIPEPENRFRLDYDFNKYELNSLCHVFARNGWEVGDLLSGWVRRFDTKIAGMYETGGRENQGRSRSWDMTSRFHAYGYYLAWHSLFLSAGTLLSQVPVTSEGKHDSWRQWLDRHLLTRQDGLWLADGTDSPPLDTLVNLLEKGHGIIGDSEKLLDLVGISSGTIGERVVVDGNWKSYDGINVGISSAFVPTHRSENLAKNLARRRPPEIWLPFYAGYESECLRNDRRGFHAWIISPTTESRLDRYDPLGSDQAPIRPYFSERVRREFKLMASDPFCRGWVDNGGTTCGAAEAWGSGPSDTEERSPHGHRIWCAVAFLRKCLSAFESDLLISIKLERFENGHGAANSKLSYSTAIVRIGKDLDLAYYGGHINWSSKE